MIVMTFCGKNLWALQRIQTKVNYVDIVYFNYKCHLCTSLFLLCTIFIVRCVTIIYAGAGIEFWIETDNEIDEDVEIESANVPPPEVSLDQDSPERAEMNIIVK